MEYLRIAQILPEFHEGGVERHVLWLSNALTELGHEVTVISAGGKLEKKLDDRVVSWKLPVHRKNPLTALYSSMRIAYRAKREGWNILHAHSRVPAWIAWWTSALCGIPWIITAHDCYRINFALKPFPKSNGIICGSQSIYDHLHFWLPENSRVIFNGIPKLSRKWKGRAESPMRFLFLGRLTHRKGLHVILQAFSGIRNEEWSLDVVGDSPHREKMESLCVEKGIETKVRFHGFSDETEKWMAECDCFLFPSLEEGMGLVLMQAVKMDVPVLASGLAPIREIAVEGASLPLPGDVASWKEVLEEVLREGPPQGLFLPEKVPGVIEMTNNILAFYTDTIANQLMKKGGNFS